jgi:hypothetical protein
MEKGRHQKQSGKLKLLYSSVEGQTGQCRFVTCMIAFSHPEILHSPCPPRGNNMPLSVYSLG